jgi:acyl-coenzyme A thioesterase PaaI-like protein
MSEWVDDRYCFACGEKNPIGMHLKFTETEKGLETKYIFPKELQGFRNIAHGGSLLLDEIMVNLPWKKLKVAVVSAEMRVKLKKPLKTGEEVTARAWIDRQKSRAIYVKGEVVLADGQVIAEGEATCVKIDFKGIEP